MKANRPSTLLSILGLLAILLGTLGILVVLYLHVNPLPFMPPPSSQLLHFMSTAWGVIINGALIVSGIGILQLGFLWLAISWFIYYLCNYFSYIYSPRSAYFYFELFVHVSYCLSRCFDANSDYCQDYSQVSKYFNTKTLKFHFTPCNNYTIVINLRRMVW